MRGKRNGSDDSVSRRSNPANTGDRTVQKLRFKMGIPILGLAVGCLLTLQGVSTAAVFSNADFEDGNATEWSKSGGSWSIGTDGSKVYQPTSAIATPTPSAVNQRTWAVQFADSLLKRYPDLNELTGKGWEYSNGIVLYGIEKVYEKTHNPRYLNYIRSYVDAYIKENGSGAVTTNLDHIQPGMLLLFLYRETGLNKYKLAADKLRASFKNRSRNAEGGFWHKTSYPNEMWVDGIYMGGPFLMKYGAMFDDLKSCANEATFQTLLLAKHAQEASGLLRHAWDCDRNAKWANASTGLSPEVWSRGIGWYAMALVDMLAYLPQDHPDYQNMVNTLKKVLLGLKNTQDPATGLWFQVVNKGSKDDNWVETSGSGMIVYALKVAVDRGYVDNSYLEVARKGWEGMKRKITLDSSNLPKINGAVSAMGVQTSYANYVNKSKVSNSPHGYCAILLAASQMDGY